MSQQSILGRIAQLARANINALLDQAEDPQKILDQLIRDYTNNMAEAEQAVAQTIGGLRMMEEDATEASAAADEWGGKAQVASVKAESLRAEGSVAEADKFDNLARVALSRQLDFEKQATNFAAPIQQQTQVVDQLKSGMDAMRGKLDQLKRKRDDLVGRAKVAQAQSQVQDAVKNIDVMDPTSEVSRFEDKIRREEARIKGQQELQASSLDAQFEKLGDEAADVEVEARLAELKMRKR